jgi:hypothetical protein
VCVGLDFAEFQQGMKEMCDIHLTRDDFDIVTENGKVSILFFFEIYQIIHDILGQ